MDDIKLWEREKELETLIKPVRIYNQDIVMGFILAKCAMLIIKSVKWHKKEGIELTNQDKIRMFGKMETFKYFEILEANTIKQAEMKQKLSKKNI